MFFMILWLVAHSEVPRTTVLLLRVAGGEAGGVSRVLRQHNGRLGRLHRHHVRLRVAQDGVDVGPGTENVRLVGVDGCQDIVEQIALLVLLVGHQASSLAGLVVEEVGVGVGSSQSRVEAIIEEEIGIRRSAHHPSQRNKDLGIVFNIKSDIEVPTNTLSIIEIGEEQLPTGGSEL